ncbi:hypothetical protein C8R47DRAFT_1150713 [Mycena vitilis]|nr:hypothetical protein C8R47DRAFT_1150713 [Mycena vitilis]
MESLSTQMRMAENTLSNPALDFPVDIWLEILPYVSDTRDLRATTLVSPELRWIAQSFLFRSFAHILRYTQPTGEDLIRLHAKIAFYTSTRIAPLVRVTKLMGNFRLPEVYGTTLCNALPAFTRLSRLVFHGVQLTPKMVAALVSTSADIRLSFILYRSVPEITALHEPVAISLEELAIYQTDPLVHDGGRWLDIANLRLLRALVLGTPESTTGCMRALTHGPLLPALEILCLDSRGLHQMAREQFVSTLVCFPALRTLDIHPTAFGTGVWPTWSAEIPSTVIPVLSYFSGPHHLAPLFCATRPISRLRIHGAIGFDLQRLDRNLFSVAQSNNSLASLELAVEYSTPEIHRTVASEFPALRSLRLVASRHASWDNPWPDLQAVLQMIDNFILPPRLEVLYLAFIHLPPINGPKIEHVVQDELTATTLRGLVRKRPSLQHISFCTALRVNGENVESTATTWTRESEGIGRIWVRHLGADCKYFSVGLPVLPGYDHSGYNDPDDPDFAAASAEAIAAEWRDATRSHGYHYVRR